eukprot:20855-Heterococcus_DN1.PRE.1
MHKQCCVGALAAGTTAAVASSSCTAQPHCQGTPLPLNLCTASCALEQLCHHTTGNAATATTTATCRSTDRSIALVCKGTNSIACRQKRLRRKALLDSTVA